MSSDFAKETPFTPEQLTDPWWRLNSLYKIKTKQGDVITLNFNWAQTILYRTMWFLNCLLKARQLGLTTAIQIFILDRCLFNDNINAGVIAHTKEDAKDFFDDKIKFAYDSLPEVIKKWRPATSDTARHLKFSNGSQIRVGTSLRSGTYQIVHVSEFGKLCARYPDKASEVISGTLNTVAPGQIIFIESTAEGPHGEFYEMCQRSENITELAAQGTTELTQMDYQFLFFPWWKHPDYVLHQSVEIPPKMWEYFRELEVREDIKLTDQQKFWYVKKEEEQGALMKQEFPATSAEAFERTIEGAIYGVQLRKARKQGRICKLPIERGVPINTFWDLGRNDVNAIWFHQRVQSVRNHFIYYTENRLVDLTFYVEQLQQLKEEHGWIYGKHYLPHDVEVTDMTAHLNQSRIQILRGAGLTPIVVVNRIKNLQDGIELTRKVFDSCYFDEEGCQIGLRALAGYEYKYDELHKTFRKVPSDNWAKNGADAFRQFAQGFRGPMATFQEQLDIANGGAGGREYRRKQQRDNNPIFNPTVSHVV